MTAKLVFFSAAAALTLSACGTVANQTVGTINVDGDDYELRTRTIERANGSFDITSVRVNGYYITCLPDSPNDCESKVRNGLSARIDRS
ncbi:hypothetical protein [uncultured Roseobacter sp.]|uniref:hypothetical protein n=1 Tax=uncultured Roseobacter sp. TaxID=114847 RepID=UPI0026165A81|nr:hypothetical protein [uncultured Roseobacter sp.]